MSILYLDASMGAAGDMLLGALLELIEDPADLVEQLNGLGLAGVQITTRPEVKCGIRGTKVDVTVNGMAEHSEDIDLTGAHGAAHAHHAFPHQHAAAQTGSSPAEGGHGHDHSHSHHHDHHHQHHQHDHRHQHGHGHHDHQHTSMAQIAAVIDQLTVSDRVKADALAVYQAIGEAESQAHGLPVSQIHFHEVGTMDAIADIVGVALAIERINPDRIYASPINTGSGQVRCAHGIVPVPAPATAALLRGLPSYGSAIQGELCTPTGAALLRHFVTDFCPQPLMRITRIGYGMGTKDFPAANTLRAMLGHTDAPLGRVIEMCCQIDDMSGEDIAFACEEIRSVGALDVYTTAISMKKGRPGVLLSVLAAPENASQVLDAIFSHTSTLGVRHHELQRTMLDRRTIEVAAGQLRVKLAEGRGVQRAKAEYDDLAKLARDKKTSLAQIRQETSGWIAAGITQQQQLSPDSNPNLHP